MSRKQEEIDPEFAKEQARILRAAAGKGKGTGKVAVKVANPAPAPKQEPKVVSPGAVPKWKAQQAEVTDLLFFLPFDPVSLCSVALPLPLRL